MQQALRPTPEAPRVKNTQTQAKTHTHISKTHTGNSFWQLEDMASWCSDAVNTAEMNK